jgi:hypothetical protein
MVGESMRKFFQYYLLLAILISIGRSQTIPITGDEKLTIKTDNTIIATGDKLTIIAIVTNVSDHSIVESVTPKGEDVSLNLIVQDGEHQSLTERPPDQSLCKGHPGCKIEQMPLGGPTFNFQVAPGKWYANKFKLDELYDLKPGTYTVQVVKGVGFHTLSSNIITITVIQKQ